MRRDIFTFVALLLIFAAFVTAQNNGNDLFKEAQKKVYEDRDFAGAIQIYDRILKDFSSDRALAGKVTIERIRAEELLGQVQIQKKYEKVIRDYGDQPGVVELARKAAAESALSGNVETGIYVASFDPLKGRVRGPVERITDWKRHERFPFFSPDGKFITLRTLIAGGPVFRLADAPDEGGGDASRGAGTQGTVAGTVVGSGRGGPGYPYIVIRSLDNREESIYQIPTGPGSIGSEWFSDSSGILYFHASSLFRLGPGGNPRRFSRITTMNGLTGAAAALSGDGKMLYIYGITDTGTLSQTAVVPFDLIAKELKRPFSLPAIVARVNAGVGNGRYIVVSPDGSTLVIVRRPDGPDARIALVQVDGENYRDIVTGVAEIRNVDWTPNGKALVFSQKEPGTEDTWRIMQISAIGGTPQFTGLRITGMGGLDISGDGTRIAFDGNGYSLSSSEAEIAVDKQRE